MIKGCSYRGEFGRFAMPKTATCLLIVLLVLQVGAARNEVSAPGFGYSGLIAAYQSSAKLKADMLRFGMSAGWFRRNDLPVDYTRLQTPQVNELPYLLNAPKRSTKPVPMVVWVPSLVLVRELLDITARRTRRADAKAGPSDPAVRKWKRRRS